MERDGATALLHERPTGDLTGWSALFACSALGTTQRDGPQAVPLVEALAWARSTAARVLVFLGGRPLAPYSAGEVPADPPHPCDASPPLPAVLRITARPFGATDTFLRYEEEIEPRSSLSRDSPAEAPAPDR